MKAQALVVAAVVGWAAFAGEIAFDGGPEGTGLELTAAENWDGDVLPGADDVAVIPIGSAAKTLTLATDWSVKGLKFTSPSAMLTIGNDANTTLTIGADGIAVPTSSSKDNGLTFKVKLATTADQTWNMGKQCLYTYGTISGTHKIEVRDLYNGKHHAAPQYDGTIHYYGGSVSGTSITLGEAAKWANCVGGSSSSLHNFSVRVEPPETTWRYSSVFPVGTVLTQLNGNVSMRFIDKANTTVVFDDKVGKMAFPEISYASPRVAQGNFQMDGGAITGRLYFSVGSTGAATMQLNDGEIMVPPTWGDEGAFILGDANVTGDSYAYQSGGTIGAPHVRLGGKQGDWTGRTGYSEYILSGGALHHYNGAGKATDIIMPAMQQNDNEAGQPAVFTQSGGEVRSKVTFGGTGDSGGVVNINWGYGMLRLLGGTFNLSSFAVKDGWNTGSSNSSYRVTLAGGTLKPTSSAVNAQLDFASGVSTLETTQDTTLNAPVWGTGTLRKTGAGDLTIPDASRLTGAIDVREGSVTVLGAYADPDEATCIKWTGDSAMANGYADGDAVEEWPEANNDGARKAGAYTIPSGDKYVYQPGLPTLVENAFGEHAGVKFDGSAMQVPAAMNPLATQSVFSVVIVLKDSNVRGTSGTTGHDWGYSGEILGNCMCGWGGNGWGVSYSSKPQSQGAILGLNSENSLASSRGGMGDGKVHVIVATVDHGVGTLNVDGAVTNRVMRANRGANLNAAFYFGFHSNGNGIFVSEKVYRDATFNGTFAEIRAYPGRALDVGEQNALVRSLLAKYGSAADAAKASPGPADGVMTVVDAPIADVPAATAVFAADDLTAEDGAAIESWPSRDGSRAFVQSVAGASATAPTLVKNDIVGHAALRFDGSAKTALGLDKDSVPWAGAKALAAAVVFRTTADGKDTVAVTYPSNSTEPQGLGILSSAGKALKASNAVAISYRKHGAVAGTYMVKDAKTADYGSDNACVVRLDVGRGRPCRLDDGAVHVAIYSVYTKETTGNAVYNLMVDGMLTQKNGVGGLGVPAAQDSNDLLVGSMNASLTRYFTGDIAEVQLFETGLSEEQMFALTESLCRKYGARPLARRLYTPGEQTARGLGVTNVNVAAGATFNVVRSATDPWTLRAGMALTGAGRVNGSVRYGEGSVFDPGAERPAVEDLQIADGATIRIGAGGLPYDLTAVASVSGTVKLDVTALDLETLKARTTLALFTPGAVADGTTFELVGGADNMSAGVRDDGSLVLHIRRGTTVIIR